jgi:hypothetical protein
VSAALEAANRIMHEPAPHNEDDVQLVAGRVLQLENALRYLEKRLEWQVQSHQADLDALRAAEARLGPETEPR